VSSPAWVLDTGAIMAYVGGVSRVGGIVADAADTANVVALPLVCVIEAYSLLDYEDHDLIRVLRTNPSVQVLVPHSDASGSDDCPAIGDMARRCGRLGAGHTAFVALTCAAIVVTTRPDQISAVLGTDWPVIEV
jgi:hypothetical protein